LLAVIGLFANAHSPSHKSHVYRLPLAVSDNKRVSINYDSHRNEFCRGWEVGFKADYCHGKSECNAPPAPPCPLPRGVDDEGYQGGLIR